MREEEEEDEEEKEERGRGRGERKRKRREEEEEEDDDDEMQTLSFSLWGSLPDRDEFVGCGRDDRDQSRAAHRQGHGKNRFELALERGAVFPLTQQRHEIEIEIIKRRRKEEGRVRRVQEEE